MPVYSCRGGKSTDFPGKNTERPKAAAPSPRRGLSLPLRSRERDVYYWIPLMDPKGKKTNRTWPTIMSRVMGPWALESLELFR